MTRPEQPKLVRPYVEPVQLRLIGPNLAVTAALDALRGVFTVTDISSLAPARGGQVRLYATLTRHPGGQP
jgi:hypothetical protein